MGEEPCGILPEECRALWRYVHAPLPGVGTIVFVSDPADVQALFQVEHDSLEMGDKDFLRTNGVRH